MALPICEICAKTGLLCAVCESKLERGEVTEVDVELSKILYQLGEGDIGFERAIETEKHIIILTSRQDIGKIIGKDGANISMISRKLGKQARVIGTGDFKEMIYDLIAPARVIGITEIFKPDGTKAHRVRINKRDRDRLRMEPEDTKRLISSLGKYSVELSFE